MYLGVGSGGQYCRNHVGCIGRAAMPSDEKTNHLARCIALIVQLDHYPPVRVRALLDCLGAALLVYMLKWDD